MMKCRVIIDVEILTSLCEGIEKSSLLEIVKTSIEERVNSVNEKGIRSFVSGVEIVE